MTRPVAATWTCWCARHWTTPLDDAAGLVDARLLFLADLQSWPEFEGQKVDLVLLTPLHPGYAGATASLAPIHRVALAQGAELK